MRNFLNSYFQTNQLLTIMSRFHYMDTQKKTKPQLIKEIAELKQTVEVFGVVKH